MASRNKVLVLLLACTHWLGIHTAINTFMKIAHKSHVNPLTHPYIQDSQQEDPLMQVCDVLRSKQGVEYRTAVVLQDRLEYVRGKDLAAHLREKPDIIAKFTPGSMYIQIYTHTHMHTTSMRTHHSHQQNR